jgi:hypothetical protein
VRIYDVEVPPGTPVLASEISGLTALDTDLDLYLFRDQGVPGFDATDVVAVSAGAGAAESIAIATPAPGSYRFAVVGFKTLGGSTSLPGTAATYDFTTWLGADPTPDDPAGPSTAPGFAVTGDPRKVTPGERFELQAVWSGMSDPGTYFGVVTYHDQTPVDAGSPFGATLVRIVKGGG